MKSDSHHWITLHRVRFPLENLGSGANVRSADPLKLLAILPDPMPER
jgi:hypothetical protein